MNRFKGYRTLIAGALIAVAGVARFVWPEAGDVIPSDADLEQTAGKIDAALLAISGIVTIVMRLITTTPFGRGDS